MLTLKNAFKTMLIALGLIIIAACSTPNPNWERKIANTAEAPANIEEIFSFKSGTYPEKGKNYFTHIKNLASSIQGIEFEFILDSKMDAQTAYKVLPTIENQAYKLKIFHSAQAATDADASIELIRFLNQTLSKKYISPFSIFELYFNGKQNDFITLQTLAKIRNLSINLEKNELYIDEGEFKSRTVDRVEYWKKIVEEFEKEERVYNKAKKEHTLARKAVMDALDKANDDEQFRSFVAKNDRKGAADLLKKYLPWEEMPPFEKMFWETHLEIMANPLPFEDRVYIFRGINDDIVQVAEEAGQELSRQEAIKEQKIFVMSTMMTKNQGTWNRRLRSLTAMYEKFMGTDSAGSSEFTQASRITTMFVKHSQDPKGSPFLSFTPKFSVANSFGSKRNSAYFIDPRMMYFNYASRFAGEIEFLLPIVTFPDDLAGVYDLELHGAQGNVEQFLKAKAIERLDHELGKGKGTAVFDRIKLNSEKYFKPVMGGKVGAVAPVKPDGAVMAFFKKILGMKTNKAAEVITEKSDMPCLDLIQLFWK